MFLWCDASTGILEGKPNIFVCGLWTHLQVFFQTDPQIHKHSPLKQIWHKGNSCWVWVVGKHWCPPLSTPLHVWKVFITPSCGVEKEKTVKGNKEFHWILFKAQLDGLGHHLRLKGNLQRPEAPRNKDIKSGLLGQGIKEGKRQGIEETLIKI